MRLCGDEQRALGMLLGLHAGDSLGATLEFQEARKLNNLHREISGGGPFDWEAGEPTDDTQMMIRLLASLVNNDDFDLEDLAQRFTDWLDSKPKDIGNTVLDALKKVRSGVDPKESGGKSEFSQGNGSLMRCAPLALFDVSEKNIVEQCSITHRHPNCISSDLKLIKILKRCLSGFSKEEVLKDIHLEDYNWDDIYCEGYVVDSLSISLWAFCKFDSFEQAVTMVVNRGGDADTLGAITGAICGAFYGVESIPNKWIQKLQGREEIKNLLKSCNV